MCESARHDSLTTSSLITSTFDFEVVLLDIQGRELKRDRCQAASFTESLGNGTTLEMVQIPAGTAQIGSLETEAGRSDSENELHTVTTPSFFMSRYPITQAQWKAVALMPKVSCPLDLEPSYFKGLNRPVEQVSWADANEFCTRLSLATKRAYRIPTEVEWEYACRAGTTTPFHFGETLTTDLANYCGEAHYSKRRTRQGHWYNGSYGKGSTGVTRNETTVVGYFQVANGFGLYDMHGNVWEWCSIYPGKIQLSSCKPDCLVASSVEDPSLQPLRGGSWRSSPAACRAASRWLKLAGSNEAFIGFRLVYSAIDDPADSEKLLRGNPSQSILSNTEVKGNLTVGNVTQIIIN